MIQGHSSPSSVRRCTLGGRGFFAMEGRVFAILAPGVLEINKYNKTDVGQTDR